MKSWITVLGIATLTAIVCALIVATSEGPDDPTPQPAQAGVQVRRLSDSPPREPARQAASDSASAPTADEPAAPEAAAAAPPQPSPAAMRDRIGTAFEAERVDTAWNSGELARLEKAIPALLPPGSQIRRVECHSTMCRIESSHAGLDQFGDFVQRAFMSGAGRVNQSGFFAGLLADPQPGQPLVTVAYLARQGHALPMPDRLAATP